MAAKLTQPLVLPAGTVLAAAVRDASGTVLFAAGTLLTQSQTLASGSVLEAGSLLGTSASVDSLIWPKGVPLATKVTLTASKVLPRGALLPSGTDVKLPGGVASVTLRDTGHPGKNWAIAPMLEEGSQSWSIRLVAGADTEAADSRLLQPHPVSGNLRLADSHYGTFGKGAQVWTLAGSEGGSAMTAW